MRPKMGRRPREKAGAGRTDCQVPADCCGRCEVSLSNPRPHHILDSVYVGLCCWNQERKQMEFEHMVLWDLGWVLSAPQLQFNTVVGSSNVAAFAKGAIMNPMGQEDFSVLTLLPTSFQDEEHVPGINMCSSIQQIC